MSGDEQAPKVSLNEQVKEAGREAGMRKSVYPGMVQRGKMTSGDMQFRMAAMEAIYRTLKWLKEHEAIIRGYVEAMNAAPELKGKIPLVLFFDDEGGRDELIAQFLAERPGVRTVKF